MEEQVGAVFGQRQIADLVDNEQCVAGQESDAVLQVALAFGLFQRGDDLGQVAEVDAFAGLDGLDAKGGGAKRSDGFRASAGILRRCVLFGRVFFVVAFALAASYAGSSGRLSTVDDFLRERGPSHIMSGVLAAATRNKPVQILREIQKAIGQAGGPSDGVFRK